MLYETMRDDRIWQSIQWIQVTMMLLISFDRLPFNMWYITHARWNGLQLLEQSIKRPISLSFGCLDTSCNASCISVNAIQVHIIEIINVRYMYILCITNWSVCVLPCSAVRKQNDSCTPTYRWIISSWSCFSWKIISQSLVRQVRDHRR